ncbi:hypothetical protein D3C84_987080 [compost metagenome]
MLARNQLRHQLGGCNCAVCDLDRFDCIISKKRRLDGACADFGRIHRSRGDLIGYNCFIHNIIGKNNGLWPLLALLFQFLLLYFLINRCNNNLLRRKLYRQHRIEWCGCFD